MVGRILWRGMLAGIVAALVAAAFAYVVAEPLVDRAIAFESGHAAHGGDDGPELVSRAVQRTWGLLTAMVVYGAGVGGLFSLMLAWMHGRVGTVGPRALAVCLAALAFLVLILVPAIKYPPNPPAVGHPDTIQLRTAAYFGMVAVSFVSAMVAVQVRRAVRDRLLPIDAAAAGIATFVLLAGAVAALLPTVDEVPAGFSAGLLWQFRLASLGTQALFWALLGWLLGRWAAPLLPTARI